MHTKLLSLSLFPSVSFLSFGKIDDDIILEYKKNRMRDATKARKQ